MKKAIIMIGFIIYGIAVGFIAVWFRQNTDMVFLLNIPGTLLGDAVYGLSIRFLDDQLSESSLLVVRVLGRRAMEGRPL